MFELRVLKGMSIQRYTQELTRERSHLETKYTVKPLRIPIAERVNPNVIVLRREALLGNCGAS